MNPIPLTWTLIIFGVLLAGNVVLGKYSLNLHEQLGAQAAECEKQRIKDAADTTRVTSGVEIKALRDQVAKLQAANVTERAQAQAAQEREAAGQALAAKYRRQLNEARKSDPRLDGSLDDVTRQRLRDYERDYQDGTSGSGTGSVPPGATAPSDPPVR